MLGVLAYLNFVTTWPSILLVTLATIYFYTTRNYNYWKSRGVNGPKPLPFIGNLGQLFVKPRLVQMVEDYKKFGKIYGIYEGMDPILMIAEPELIRDVWVKDFHKFVDRGLPPFGNPLLDRSLLTAKGDQWKQLRVTVSPTFSSSKIKKLHKLIQECVERLDSAMLKVATSDNNNFAIKKLINNYTMDVIALSAFATKIQTYNKEVHPFIRNAQFFFTPTLSLGLFLVLNNTFPSLVKRFNLSFAAKQVNYFKATIQAIISERESQKGGKFVDFLQLLIDAKKKQDHKDIDEDIQKEVEMINDSMKKKILYQLEDIDIMATASFFILAGSETTSATISHLLHEMALNPECQQKLVKEIKSAENLDYETISQLPYLDACLNETLRKYPAVVFNQRVANEDYELGDTGLVVPKGMPIRIPIYALHHDSNRFPNPEQFDPERFTPENKSRIVPYSFLPFGAGPRNCIGMRFALMNVKTAVAHLLSKYEFIQTPDTKSEFEYKKFVLFPQAIDMGTVRLELRK